MSGNVEGTTRVLSGRGLTDAALRSILNRGPVGAYEPLPPAHRRVLTARWQAHHETLSRAIDRVLEAIRSQDAIPVWPLGKTYWVELLLAERTGYCELMAQVDAELAVLSAN